VSLSVEQAEKVLMFARELCEGCDEDAVAGVPALLNTAYFLHCIDHVAHGADLDAVIRAIDDDREGNVAALRKMFGAQAN
jgi:hypothetical protein